MDIILDIQGFMEANDQFVLKELAAITIQRTADGSSALGSFLFKPPYDWENLPAEYKSMNLWLTHNFHGLSWNVGDFPYSKIKDVIDGIIKDKCYIYVKGSEKKRWIEKIIEYCKPVIDMEEFGCNPLQRSKVPACWHHIHYSVIPKYMCAFHDDKDKHDNEYYDYDHDESDDDNDDDDGCDIDNYDDDYYYKDDAHGCWHHINHSMIAKYTCAFKNVQRLKIWYKRHKIIETPSIEKSLVLYHQLGSTIEMKAEDIAQFPKNFLTMFESNNIDEIWNKLPIELQNDKEIANYRRCYKHYNMLNNDDDFDGPTPLIKNCPQCQSSSDDI